MEKKKVLIVDDEAVFAQVVKFNLESTGKYSVRLEHKGARGFDVAKEFKPDLILLDIMMPDMSGEKVAHRLKNFEDTKNIPIVLMTAIVSEEEAKKRDNIFGNYPVIAKPVDIEKLLRIVGENIR